MSPRSFSSAKVRSCLRTRLSTTVDEGCASIEAYPTASCMLTGTSATASATSGGDAVSLTSRRRTDRRRPPSSARAPRRPPRVQRGPSARTGVHPLVPVDHLRAAETFDRPCPAPYAVEPVERTADPDQLCHLLDIAHEEPGDAGLDQLRCAPARKGDDRAPAEHGLDHDEPERLLPLERNERHAGIAEQRRFL